MTQLRITCSEGISELFYFQSLITIFVHFPKQHGDLNTLYSFSFFFFFVFLFDANDGYGPSVFY